MLITRRRTPDRSVSGPQSPPRLGVLVSHPIQYQAPLYQELARRGAVDLEVAFLSSDGAQPYHDTAFGVTLAWNIDLLSGYRSTVLARRPLAGKPAWLASLRHWLRGRDIVVLHGHSDPDILLAAATCRLLGVPYLLRGDSHAEPSANGWRRVARHLVAGAVIRSAGGALPIGQRNAAFYRRYGRIPHYLAPYSVDNDRFQAMSEAARPARAERLAALGLDPAHPTVIFSGKLIEQKRPLDLVHAIGRCGGNLNLLVLGDGALRAEVRGYEGQLPVRCLGFVNQAELPAWYGCGDVLALPSDREPWGLVVNEGMACGLVPVVSDAVGCAADLVDGVGEVYPAGDVTALAAALTRASANARDRRECVRARLSRFTLASTASGYEQAAIMLGRPRAGRPAGCRKARPGLQQPVDGQRGVPVRREPFARPLRSERPHLAQLSRLRQQAVQDLGQCRRALVPRCHAGDPVQVGVESAAVRGPDHRGAGHLRLD
jgi:glycosyltransferase involved in cell wall biosynthesis